MNVGTRSLLFGVHQFLWHPFTVWLAWVRLYGEFPSWRECVCIFVHDWGYWGCPNMDGEEGETHPAVGAAIAGFLFGPAYYDLVMHHSRYLSKKLGRQPSKLCWADKVSMVYEPAWFYLLRAHLSGEIREYRKKAHDRGFFAEDGPDRAWLAKLTRHVNELAYRAVREYLPGWKRVLLERRRQREVECWNARHDDAHDRGELHRAACCYESYADGFIGWRRSYANGSGKCDGFVPRLWPWERRWWKPEADAVRNYEKAGALYLAEADRFDRSGNRVLAYANRANAERCGRKIDEVLG